MGPLGGGDHIFVYTLRKYIDQSLEGGADLQAHAVCGGVLDLDHLPASGAICKVADATV